MPTGNENDPLRLRLGTYVLLVVATIGYLAFNFRLHHADLRTPLCPTQNDSAALLSLVTAVRESGWPWIVERAGAPGVAERYDYPMPELIHYLTLRGIFQFTDNTFLAFNIWALLSYPLTAVCSMAVMRSLGISRPIGFALTLIYTFLPYHAGRLFSHTLIAHYQTVPLILLPIIWIAIGRLPFLSSKSKEEVSRLPTLATTGWTVLLASLVSLSSPYYAFFGCFFLVVAGLYRSLGDRSWRPFIAAFGVCGIMVGVGIAAAQPSTADQRDHGTNPGVSQRNANESEVYCLKVTQLLLPFGDHRIGAIGHITRLYNSEAPNSNENRDSVLGSVGALGFLILVFRLFLTREPPSLLGGLAMLNIAAVIVGASGGFGGLFNFLVFPQVRCYNRLSIFIAFWSLLTIGVLLDRWTRSGGSWQGWLIAIVIGGFGLLDVTSRRQAPSHLDLQQSHHIWQDFVERMEATLPEGAMVFQLPAASYPEAGTTHRLPDYAHLTCHVYSKKLRWSYGTNRNRRWDEWHQYVASLTPSEMVESLALAGFQGVYVDRRGYADNGEAMLAQLRLLLGGESVASESGEQLLFSLSRAEGDLRKTLDERERERKRLLNRPCVLCQQGFLPWAPVNPPEARRAHYSAEMRVINPGESPRQVTLSMEWQRHTSHEIEVHVTSPTLGIVARLSPPMDRGPMTLQFNVSPGEHIMRFEAKPQPVGWPRMYSAWNAVNVRLTE